MTTPFSEGDNRVPTFSERSSNHHGYDNTTSHNLLRTTVSANHRNATWRQRGAILDDVNQRSRLISFTAADPLPLVITPPWRHYGFLFHPDSKVLLDSPPSVPVRQLTLDDDDLHHDDQDSSTTSSISPYSSVEDSLAPIIPLKRQHEGFASSALDNPPTMPVRKPTLDHDVLNGEKDDHDPLTTSRPASPSPDSKLPGPRRVIPLQWNEGCLSSDQGSRLLDGPLTMPVRRPTLNDGVVLRENY
jgi:hypothetical protein